MVKSFGVDADACNVVEAVLYLFSSRALPLYRISLNLFPHYVVGVGITKSGGGESRSGFNILDACKILLLLCDISFKFYLFTNVEA